MQGVTTIGACSRCKPAQASVISPNIIPANYNDDDDESDDDDDEDTDSDNEEPDGEFVYVISLTDKRGKYHLMSSCQAMKAFGASDAIRVLLTQAKADGSSVCSV